jgi:hypothetical protein
MLQPLSWALLTHAHLLVVVTAESSISHVRAARVLPLQLPGSQLMLFIHCCWPLELSTCLKWLQELTFMHQTHAVCFAMQRLTGLQRAQMHLPSGRQALTEIPMPQLRQRGLPHAPMPKQGTYNGPASLRLKPMSTGLPPTQPVVNVHDSLALSAWAGAGRRSAQTESV